MIGHLGHKVSPLVDGQLPPAEAERWWSHVHTCAHCRSLVEHEGWVKTRLAGLALSGPQPTAPGHLHGRLCDPAAAAHSRPDPVPVRDPGRRRAVTAAAVVSAGSVGAAVVGVLALALPAGSPVLDRRGPTTSLVRPSDPPRTASSRVMFGPVAPAASVTLRGSATSTSAGMPRLGASIQQWETIAP